MAATMKGAISFGLLHVPIALHTATQDNDIRFNQLCREDGSRVKYKKVCAKCGKEVSAQDCGISLREIVCSMFPESILLSGYCFLSSHCCGTCEDFNSGHTVLLG